MAVTGGEEVASASGEYSRNAPRHQVNGGEISRPAPVKFNVRERAGLWTGGVRYLGGQVRREPLPAETRHCRGRRPRGLISRWRPMTRVASVWRQANRPSARCGSNLEAVSSREYPVNTLRTFITCLALVALVAACATEEDGEAGPANGSPVACEDIIPGLSNACSRASEGMECELNSGCACGDCFVVEWCTCRDGMWGCSHLSPSSLQTCEGRRCADESDCDAFVPTTCTDGFCTDPRSACVELDDQETCDARYACTWMVPPACPTTDGPPSIAEAGCFAAPTDCFYSGLDPCPRGFSCTRRSVAPRCLPEDPACDACSEERFLCVPNF